MADHFGDPRLQFESVKAWFDHLTSFGSRPKYNTYIGFFYTIEGGWDPEVYPSGRFPPRWPWLAIYRPMNPHFSPYQATELMIWDIAARKLGSTMCPAKADLIPAQRYLIDYVQEHGKAKNPTLPLKQVWLGGFASDEKDLSSPLDQTLVTLKNIMTDAWQWLPAKSSLLRSRGFKAISLHSNEADARRQSPELMDLEPPDALLSSSGRQSGGQTIVFHPPRGNTGGAGVGLSKCTNRLYEEASRNVRLNSFTYTFEPTLAWYLRQKVEGRAYEHINVDTWEPIFKSLQMTIGADQVQHDKKTSA